MPNRARALVLLAVMLWQSLAWLTPPGIGRVAETIGHQFAHAQVLGHHHHDDLALHIDGDAAESLHYHADSGLQPTSTLPPTVLTLPHLLPPTPMTLAARDPACCSPESPHRPPRRTI